MTKKTMIDPNDSFSHFGSVRIHLTNLMGACFRNLYSSIKKLKPLSKNLGNTIIITIIDNEAKSNRIPRK